MDSKAKEQAEKLQETILECWGFKVSSLFSWSKTFQVEIEGKSNVCVLKPYSIVMNPNSEGIGDLFLYANHQVIDANEHSNYLVDFVGEKFFLRFLRAFDNKSVCWKIVFFRVNKDTGEQDSGQVVDIC